MVKKDRPIMKKEIVQYILQFAEQNLNYLILRNYENLPEDEGHDIDFLIEESDLPKSYRLVQEIKAIYHVRIFTRQQYYGLCGYVIVIDDTILHLDFFTKIQWNRFNYISTKDALSHKKRFRNLWVISDEDLYYYCWVLYIRANGHIKEKYRENAFRWEDEYNKNMYINIRSKSSINNKAYLIKLLIRQTGVFRTITNTFANICFKVWKLTSMDGRIYVTDDIHNKNLVTLRKYCSCNQKDIASLKEINIPSLIKLLYREYSILVSPSEWGKIWWTRYIPSPYIVNTVEDLDETVNNIYRGVEV